MPYNKKLARVAGTVAAIWITAFAPSAVAADDNGVAFSNRKNGCAFELIQWVWSRVRDFGALDRVKRKMGCNPVIFKSLM